MTINRLKILISMGLGLSIMSILAGAIVRATGSGSGCGASWPTCNGNMIPELLDTPAMIEYTHRVLSGILLLVTLLVFLYIRKYSSDPILIRAANLLLFFVIIEALIGMAIVLLELVAFNTSLARLIAVPIHLVNTFSLVALYVITYCILNFPVTQLNFYLNNRFIISCLLFFLVAATGSITALSDLLYPSDSFIQGLAMDFSDSSQILTRLRVLHPFVAIVLIVWIFFEGRRLFVQENISSAAYLIILASVVSFIGIINVITNINIFLSISHLFFADLLWGFYIYSNMDILYNSKKANI